MKPCKHCKKPFKPRKASSRYCSRECYVADTGKYDWDGWFAQKQFTAVWGTDFDSQMHGFLQTVRKEAWKRQIRISIHVDGDSVAVTVNGRKGRA